MAKDSSSPKGGRIEWDETGILRVPDRPTIPYIVGDGTGPDIWAAAQPVFDAAVERAYGGAKGIDWLEVLAGERAQQVFGPKNPLPHETFEKISYYRVAIKGPLTTPVGTGFRSLNVAMRRALDLFACVRPVRHIPGVPSPVSNPDKLDIVVFRENTEDVYAGLEWPAGSDEARAIIACLNSRFIKEDQERLSPESAIGIKPMSKRNTARLTAMAVRYAMENNRESVTLVHKGNIMKYTEGGFRDWAYDTAEELYRDEIVTEQELNVDFGGIRPPGKIVIKDRIADAMFQQLLLRPEEYDVIATPNLNGDYLSDAAAAQAGGLGLAPGANIGDKVALFEATHGSAPKYAGLDKVNPGSLILSGVEMLKFIGWNRAAELITASLIATIGERQVTYDLARQMTGATEVRCSEFGELIRNKIRHAA